MKFQYLFFTLVISVVFLSCKNDNPQESTNNIFKFRNWAIWTTKDYVVGFEELGNEIYREIEILN